MQSKHVLFDLDGTLTDSSKGIVNSIRFALTKMGITEKDHNKLVSFIGPSLKQTFKKNYFPNEKDQDLAIQYYREYFASKGIFENELYLGIEALLAQLKKNNYTISLATAKPTYFANIILNHFKIDSYFSVVVGSHLTGKRTDKIEIIEEVVDQLGRPSSSDCAMIGDREYDIKGGNHHDMTTVGVSYGFGKIQELQNANPNFIANSVDELLQYLCRNNAAK